MRTVPICPYCGRPSRFIDSSTGVLKGLFQKFTYGPVWVCEGFPECDAYVGCHPGTDRPLGTLANRELREWRKAAHEIFDPLWMEGKMNRADAYRLLQKMMGMKSEEAHIALFSIEQCKELVDLLEVFWDDAI